jgi:phosphatidylinositol alpha 1,6-mannosyltransferase
VWRWLLRFHRPAAFTHTPGEAVRAELARRGLTRVRVWGHAVDATLFDHRKRDERLRRRLGVSDATALVLHVGRLAVEKNLETLVEAWTLARKQLGDAAVFLFAGDGPVARRCAAAMPWAIHMGVLPPAVLAMLYASADLCVLPSRTETCGLVALEALASGLPVIAADAGGFRETVTTGSNGFLVAPDDARGFAAAVARLVLDRRLRHRMSEQARLSAVMRDVEGENQQLLDEYAFAIGQPSLEGQWRAA